MFFFFLCVVGMKTRGSTERNTDSVQKAHGFQPGGLFIYHQHGLPKSLKSINSGSGIFQHIDVERGAQQRSTSPPKKTRRPPPCAVARHPIAHGALAQVVPRKPGGLRQHPLGTRCRIPLGMDPRGTQAGQERLHTWHPPHANTLGSG